MFENAICSYSLGVLFIVFIASYMFELLSTQLSISYSIIFHNTKVFETFSIFLVFATPILSRTWFVRLTIFPFFLPSYACIHRFDELR